MSNVISGMDAINALNGTGNSGGGGTDWTTFSGGTTLLVKVIGKEIDLGGGKTQMVGDMIGYFNYGVYKKVNSFVAKNPSKKSPKGYPIENLTPWDKAWKYHADLSEKFQDYHSQEGFKYKPAQKFAFGFFDLDSGKPIVVDLTKKQAVAVNNSIKKYGKKLDKIAFELSKEGESTSTVVSLTPILDMDEDITDKQRENFAKAPDKFDEGMFEGLLYEAEESEQLELLTQAGFDITLIGFDKGDMKSDASDEEAAPIGSGEGGEITDDDLPF